MAVRTWANALGVGAGTGLLAGAGQLGIVYGLGIVRWDRDFATGAPWHAQLAWVAFLASASVVIGSLTGAWQARRLRLAPSIGLRIALAFAAAVGASILLPLVARPAATSHLAEAGNPRLSALLVAAVGLVIGLVAGVAVLAVPPVSGSVVATVLWVWIAALISAASTLGRGASWASAELGLLPVGRVWLPVTLLVPAVLIALAVAAVARFGGSDLRAVAICGLAGPALIALAYLVAGPGGGAQTDAYRYALFAVCAGFAVSAVIAVVRRRNRRTTVPTPAPEPEAAPAPDEAPASGSSPDTIDYGWPAPEPEEPDTDTRRVALPPPEPEPEAEPAPQARKPARRRAPAKKAAEAPATPEAAPVSPAPVSPAPVSPAGPSRGKTPARAAAPAAVAPAPAAGTPAPVQEAEPMEPSKAKGRLGRRSRREPAPDPAVPAKPAKPAKVRKAQAREEDHVDWVKSLGGGEGPRIGGVEPARHADPFDDDET
jgi:hypothetical protein